MLTGGTAHAQGQGGTAGGALPVRRLLVSSLGKGEGHPPPGATAGCRTLAVGGLLQNAGSLPLEVAGVREELPKSTFAVI